jgi:hypothetical protein
VLKQLLGKQCQRRGRFQVFLLSFVNQVRYTYARTALPTPHRLLHTSAVSGGGAMTFEEILDQAIAMLQRRGRVTYGTLKRQSVPTSKAPLN